MVGLPGTAAMRPADLSGGMRKRVGLPRAIGADPEVILYDEPTTELDPVNGRRIGELVRSIQRALQVTSSWPASARRIDRVVATVEKGEGSAQSLLYRDDVGALLGDARRAPGELADLAAAIRTGDGLLHTLVYERDRSELLANLTRLSRTLGEVADEVHAGKGTVGALLKDPSVYEDLKTILGNLKRNRLLRALVRYTISSDGLKAGSR